MTKPSEFLLNSCKYPGFEILIREEKKRVLSQRTIFNWMHAIKQFEKIRAFFLILSKCQKPENNTNLTKKTCQKHERFCHI